MTAKKICSKCHTEKPVTDFSYDSRRKDGRFPMCKQCKKELYYKYKQKKNSMDELKAFMKKVTLKTIEQEREINDLKNTIAEIITEKKMNLPGPYQHKQKEYFDPSDPMNQ